MTIVLRVFHTRQKYIFVEILTRMITVISGTNRENSETLKVAKIYQDILSEMGQENQLLDLQELSGINFHSGMYAKHEDQIKELYNKYVKPVDRFVFVVPEYNGSYPGVVKLFLDLTPPVNFNKSKAALVGVSSGRAGNLRGMEHLTGVLNYLKVSVLFAKPKLSGIEGLLDENGAFVNERNMKQLAEHAELFVQF